MENQSQKLLAKKNDFRSGKDFSKFCLETISKSQINQMKKIIKT